MNVLPTFPNPEDVPRNAPLRLITAARLAFPDGAITAKSLRVEAKRGRLRVFRIAGKDFTTLAEIERMVELCVPPPETSARASGSSRSGETRRQAVFSNERSGAFAMQEHSSAAQDALLATVRKLKDSLQNTSLQKGRPRALGVVTPLRSGSHTR